MNKAQAKAILSAMDAKGIPDSAVFAVKTVGGEIMHINPNSFAVVGEDADVSLDASNQWAGSVTEISAVYLKQD